MSAVSVDVSFQGINGLISSYWIGKNINQVIIKKEDTDQNFNFYQLMNVANP